MTNLSDLFPGAASPVVLDNFYAAVAGTDLESVTPDIDSVGGGWVTPYAQKWELATANNRAAEVTAGWSVGYEHAYIDSGISDCRIDVLLQATKNSGNTSGIIFRSIPDVGTPLDTASWKVNLYNGDLSIVERESGGTETTRATIAVTHTSLQIYPLWVILNGSSITAYMIDNVGEKSINYTSTANLTATKHGIFANAAAHYFHSFKVSP